MQEQITIEEGNKIIAVAIGGVLTHYPYKIFPNEIGYRFPVKIPFWMRETQDGYWWNVNALVFHSSWDWIMVAVEKVNILCATIGYPDDFALFNIRLISSQIDIVWISVVEYFSWYNNLQK